MQSQQSFITCHFERAPILVFKGSNMEISRLVDPYVLLNEIYLNVVFCYTFLFSMYLLNLAAYLYTISPAENAAYIVKPLLPSKENRNN